MNLEYHLACPNYVSECLGLSPSSASCSDFLIICTLRPKSQILCPCLSWYSSRLSSEIMVSALGPAMAVSMNIVIQKISFLLSHAFSLSFNFLFSNSLTLKQFFRRIQHSASMRHQALTSQYLRFAARLPSETHYSRTQ